MTQAQKTFSGTPSLLPAALAAIVAAAAVSTAIILVQLELPAPGGQATTQTHDQAVVDAGRAWEQQRIQQSAFGAVVVSDAVMDAAREWERQQIQQSPGRLGAGAAPHSPTAPTPR